MATHSSILAWRIPWTEEPGWLQPMRLQNRTRLSDIHKQHIHNNKGKQGLIESVSHLSFFFFFFNISYSQINSFYLSSIVRVLC